MSLARITAERFTEVLERFIDDKLENMDRVVEVDDVDGLENYVEKEVESQLNNFEPDADNIQGLERFVENVVDSFQIQVDNIEGLDDSIEEKINSYLHHDFAWSAVLTQVLQTPEFKQALDQAVRESLLRLIQQLFTGMVPIAQPVGQPVGQPARFNSEGVITQQPDATAPVTITPEMRSALGL